ncbi:MAG: hypothetical protein U0527_10145 [Candidatus Eisenbacteria bacterium]
MVRHGQRLRPGPACPQPKGACCFEDGTCTVSTEEECLGNGQYYGDGTICDPNPCPQPPGHGACCLPTGECVITTADDCAAQGGDYQGDNTVCDPNPCTPPVPTQKSTWGRIKGQFR